MTPRQRTNTPSIERFIGRESYGRASRSSKLATFQAPGNAIEFCPFPDDNSAEGGSHGTPSISLTHGPVGSAAISHCCRCVASANRPQATQNSDEERLGFG